MLNIALLGAGLHNLLLALWLREKSSNPEASPSERSLWIEVFERETAIPIGRTISAHESDIPSAMRPFLARYTSNRWSSYTVAFDGSRRSIPLGYLTLDLERIRADVEALDRAGLIALHLGQSVHPHQLPKSVNGQPFQICCDSSGASTRTHSRSGTLLRPDTTKTSQGVQQFYGRTYRYPDRHGLSEPVIMDARVPQPETGGFRFIYLLPCSDEHLLVEDTRLIPEPVAMSALANCVSPDLPHQLEPRAQRASGSTVVAGGTSRLPALSTGERTVEVTHEENGRIPIPLHAWDSPVFSEREHLGQSMGCAVIPVGLAAGYFNPTTGYSLPHALRSIQALGQDISKTLQKPYPEQMAGSALCSFTAFSAFARSTRTSWPAYRLFNLLLFYGFPAGKASHAFAYFYALPVRFVQRFYSGQLRLHDLWIFLLRPAPRHFLFRRIPLIASHFMTRRAGPDAQCLDG